MGTFAYVPLHCTESRRIRLVKLAPLAEAKEAEASSGKETSGKLACQLLETLLDVAPPYIAISHAWGDATRHKASILVNGHAHNVSQTLADLLAYLQRYCRPRSNHFWIDELCINQEDVVEKGIQVGLMRQVYEKAWVLIAWLGTIKDFAEGPGQNGAEGKEGEEEEEEDEEDRRSDRDGLKDIHSLHGFFQAYVQNKDRYGVAMKRKELRFPIVPYAHRTKEVLVYELDANGCRINNIKGLTEDESAKVNESASVVEARLRYHIGNQRNSQDWSWGPVSRLLARPWFSRIWLVLEVYCAKNVQLAFGSHMISWTVLAEVCEAIVKYGLERNFCHIDRRNQLLRPAGFRHIIALARMRDAKVDGHGIDLTQILLRTRSFEVLDVRDRVYSLLSLASESDRTALPRDYGLSQEELAIKLAAHLLKSSSRPEEILSLAGIGWGTANSSVPSWVPSWSNLPANLKQTHSRLFHHNLRPVNNTPAGSGTARQVITIRPDLTTLRAEGYVVDKVQFLMTTACPNIGENFDITTADQHNRAPWTDWMLDAVDMLNQGAASPYPTREPLNEVLWRTLITSRTLDGAENTPAGPEYGLSFRRSVGRPFDSIFTTTNSDSSTALRTEQALHEEEAHRLLQTLTAHIDLPQVSPGRAYIERMSYSSSQTFRELERLWRRSYNVHGRGKCLFTTKNGFVGLAAPGLAKGGEFYIAYLRCSGGSDGGKGRRNPLVLKREPCHEVSPGRVMGGPENDFGPGSRANSNDSGTSGSNSICGSGKRYTSVKESSVQRFRLVSECYLHGGYILENKARHVQTLDIY
ncbi:heterokaryon incompatibility protein-domain-containing protein [Microdochium trichocladiopsis]|uniref:Heterokaryon incompatibility protein-domain-containing protein n=1 Tax=Microdochium trichocladiopsis TaxID=1682393 RepID=A0A9P8XRZ4_9PEZI|nr:heterokaryon incompatibility protein-domain-containing protein [Microdochium trichocladiopsis]KAH7014317.1 heterokaryon incompatibility protein-domain-containing protein [Microdochium trichocladiopsis]